MDRNQLFSNIAYGQLSDYNTLPAGLHHIVLSTTAGTATGSTGAATETTGTAQVNGTSTGVNATSTGVTASSAGATGTSTEPTTADLWVVVQSNSTATIAKISKLKLVT